MGSADCTILHRFLTPDFPTTLARLLRETLLRSIYLKKVHISLPKEIYSGTSLVGQRLRIHLPMQGTRV